MSEYCRIARIEKQSVDLRKLFDDEYPFTIMVEGTATFRRPLLQLVWSLTGLAVL